MVGSLTPRRTCLGPRLEGPISGDQSRRGIRIRHADLPFPYVVLGNGTRALCPGPDTGTFARSLPGLPTATRARFALPGVDVIDALLCTRRSAASLA